MLGNQVACWGLLSFDNRRHINCALETSVRNGPTVKAMTAVGEVEERKKKQPGVPRSPVVTRSRRQPGQPGQPKASL